MRNKSLHFVKKRSQQRITRNQSIHGRRETSDQQGQSVDNYSNTTPRRLLRTAARDLTIPRSSIQLMLINRLRIFPYKIQILQEFENHDYSARTLFDNWWLKNIPSDIYFLNSIFFD